MADGRSKDPGAAGGGVGAGLSIGQVASAAGVGVETIRFYERKGLVEQPEKPLFGHRKYPVETAARIRFIRRAKELGFTLGEIAELLELRVDPGKSCSEVRTRALAGLAAACRGQGPTSDRPILEAMEDGAKQT